MDQDRFDALARHAAGNSDRRGMIRAVVGCVLGLLVAARGDRAEAAGCRKPGDTCKRRTQCCSGVSRNGKCRPAPGQGTCTIRKDTCKLTGGIGEGPKCNGVQGCECITTKTGAAFCREIGGAACTACDNDQDCAAAFGLGAKCIRGAACGDPCGIGNFCAVPCGFDAAALAEDGGGRADD